MIDNMKQIDCGFECKVYRVSKAVVYKDYKCGMAAGFLDSRALQQRICQIYRAAFIAAEAGLAPAVYQRTQYGYYTECVEPLQYTDDYATDDEIDELQQALENLFDHAVTDLHCGNLARNKDGKLICIDFGIGVGIDIASTLRHCNKCDKVINTDDSYYDEKTDMCYCEDCYDEFAQ